MDQPQQGSPWPDSQPRVQPAATSEDDAPFELLGDEDVPTDTPPGEDPSSYVDDQVGEDGTRFEPLNAGAGRPKVPFTDEEILDGTAIIAMLAGSRVARVPIDDEGDVDTFKWAYKSIFAPYVTTEAVIAPLKLGDALARYGIHKNMGPGFDLETIPAWIRLTLGAGLLSVSTFLATMAVARRHAGEPNQPAEPPRDPLNTDPPNAPREPEPQPPTAGDPPAGEAARAGPPPENGVRPGQTWA